MLRKTLLAVTAIVIGTSGINAEVVDKSVSVSVNPDAKKSVIVVPTGNIISNPAQAQSTAGVYNLHPTPRQVIRPARSSQGYSDTIIYASGAKNSYKVDEPIHIKLKLKRKAFIYFWTIPANGNGYLILPNDLESLNRYRANVNYVVPERSANYDFISDRAGVEQVYVLATNKKINTNKIRSIFKNRKASNKSIRKFITKDIKVIARNKNLKYDIASFQIQVHAKNQTPSNVNIIINQ